MHQLQALELVRAQTYAPQRVAGALGPHPSFAPTLSVGLEPLASGTWNVFFGPVHLAGWMNETIAFTTTEDD